MKKLIASALVVALGFGSAAVLPAHEAFAQYRNWDRHAPPPPPPQRRHRNNTGKIIAGGLAAGVIGGLIGGALAGDHGERTYLDEEVAPPYRPRCWIEDREVRNTYDHGWHMESVRVCD